MNGKASKACAALARDLLISDSVTNTVCNGDPKKAKDIIKSVWKTLNRHQRCRDKNRIVVDEFIRVKVLKEMRRRYQ